MREPCEESVREIALEVASSPSSGPECDLWVLVIVVWIAKYNVSEDAKRYRYTAEHASYI